MHVASLVVTDIAIVVTFLALLILILVHERNEKRKRAMAQHPAGKGIRR